MKYLQVLLLLRLPVRRRPRQKDLPEGCDGLIGIFPTMSSAVKTRTVKCDNLPFSLECWQTSELRLISFYWRKDDNSLRGFGVLFYLMLGNAGELPLPLSLKLLLQSIYWNENSVYKLCWRNKGNFTLVVALLFTQDFLQHYATHCYLRSFSCILK